MRVPTQICKPAKQVFDSILQQLGRKNHLIIGHKGADFMPLYVEKINDGIKSPWGTGYLLSLAHYYEQNGDLMQDPEIVYLVVDNREHPEQLDLLRVWPQSYQLSSLSIYRELITIENDKVKSFRPKQQKDCASFTKIWMNNLQYQQGIKPIKIK